MNPLSGHPLCAPARRRVILVSLDWTREKDSRLSLGHASLAAALTAAAHVELVPFTFNLNRHRFDASRVGAILLEKTLALPSANVDICIGAYVWNEPYLNPLLTQLRASGFRGRIILGGPQISYSGSEVARLYPAADGFIRGYGEDALVQVTRTSDRIQLQGCHWAGTQDMGGIAKVALERLPSPHLSGILPISPGQRSVRWETQRGCPYRCSFCQHREAGRPEAGRLERRHLNSTRLQQELAFFANHSLESISVLDPTFNLDAHACAVLNAARAVGIGARLSLQCRFERLGTDFLDACSGLNVILEFGLQTLHLSEGRAIRRYNKPEQVSRCLAGLHDRRLPFEVNLIYALPNQTLASFEASIAFCLQHRVPVIKAFPLVLLRGTSLEQRRDRWGLVQSDDFIPRVIRSHTFSIDDWCRMAALSLALEKTQGRHPASLDQLRRLADPVDIPRPLPRLSAWPCHGPSEDSVCSQPEESNPKASPVSAVQPCPIHATEGAHRAFNL